MVRHAAIRRDAIDPTKRIVWGEVMVPPKVDIVPGGTYRASEVADALHYDGLFLGRKAVRDLAYRMSGVRIDVNHDNEPIFATIAENYVARSGDPMFPEGAHVCGIHIGDGATYAGAAGKRRDVWADGVEGSDLTGFSIDFLIAVRSFDVTITDEDGSNPRKLRVEEAIDPRPRYLSLVRDPASGRHFKSVSRGVVDYQDLPLAPADTEWNPALAQVRLRAWARTGDGESVDVQRFARAFLLRSEDDPALLGSYRLLIGDVQNGALVAVPAAIDVAAASLESAEIEDVERAAARAHLGRYYARMRKAPPWADEDNAHAAEVVRATDEEHSMSMKQSPIVSEADERAVGATILRVLRRSFGLGGAEPDSSEDTDPATDPESAPGEEPSSEPAEVVRGAFADALAAAGAAAAFNAAWFGFDVLMSAFWRAYEADADDATKLSMMGEAAGDFGDWLQREIGRIASTPEGAEVMRAAVERLRAAIDAAPDGEVATRVRAAGELAEATRAAVDAGTSAKQRAAALEAELQVATQRAAALDGELAAATRDRDGLRELLDEHIKTVDAMRRAKPPGTALPADTNESPSAVDDDSPHAKLRGAGLAPSNH